MTLSSNSGIWRKKRKQDEGMRKKMIKIKVEISKTEKISNKKFKGKFAL